MKTISDYILDIFIVLFVTILIVLITIQNHNYQVIMKNHYDVVNKLKESVFITELVNEFQSDVISIKKESDNVYEVTSTYDFNIPLIFYHDNRTLKEYVYIQEWQK